MYKAKEYINKIVQSNNQESMKALNDVLLKSLEEVKSYNSKDFSKLEMWLYEIANGKELTEEMAREWVKGMQPIGEHWTILETNEVLNKLGYTLNRVDFYVVMNMIYNDYYDVVRDDDNLTVKIAKDWLNDEDAREQKLYRYWKHIVNRE